MKCEEVRNIVVSKLRNGETPTNICRDLCGEVSLATIKRWKTQYDNDGQVIIHRAGRPVTAATARNIKKILHGKVNHQNYIKNVLPVALRYGNKYFGRDWTFQQDGARAHTHELSQKYCRDKMPRFIPKDRWPPNSPDLNPLDYFVRNEIATHMRWDLVDCKTTLISEIKRSVKLLRKETLLDSCASWYTRVRKVGTRGGTYLG